MKRKNKQVPKWVASTLEIVLMIAILFAAYYLASPILTHKPVDPQTWLYFPVQMFVALIAVGAYSYWKEKSTAKRKAAEAKAKKDAEIRKQREVAESSAQHEANIKRNQNVKQNRN
ncbi:hypothetical protein [Secundilactobacillus malefermentans]|uniref:Uncharacterized protein n=1 Tax=Secundilactobacillus malefermentans TaxID=176292 RepID=A0A4R5NFT5_9LACO|nr:hypothetical protein [Secundilactobacillus malefermentans]KRM57573.1 hypothetical protein FD44_GL001088 [Secundilactobacillus malefermentans DSM 5705 = KCTC 3548]QEA31163.1 hypothetical protein FGL90_02705 [Secundilactobacillus malefermentans]TDG72943.1 hypothetical protein C5L31_000268 [Secundilactobacillus malefermentans]